MEKIESSKSDHFTCEHLWKMKQLWMLSCSIEDFSRKPRLQGNQNSMGRKEGITENVINEKSRDRQSRL